MNRLPTSPSTTQLSSVSRDGEVPPIELQRPATPAFAASLFVHVCLIVALGWWNQNPSHGTTDQPDREVGIAIVHRQPDRDRYVDAEQITSDATEEQTAAGDPTTAISSAPPADLAPPIDLAGLLDSMQSAPSPVASSGLAGDVALSGDAAGGNNGRDTKTSPATTTAVLFGVSGSGSRFVYVFDRSDSMNGSGGRPLRAAKRELVRSLESLTDRQQFQIIFYNDTPTPFQVSGLALQMHSGEPEMIKRAIRYVDAVKAFGGTEHDSALKLALRMSPDVIFFLTDARIPSLSEAELFEIQRRAERIGATIHAIEFGADPVAPNVTFLRELAAMNGGQYQYINTNNLSATSAGE